MEKIPAPPRARAWGAISICAAGLLAAGACHAGGADRLAVNAETEYTFSDFERDPEPAQSETGANLSQEYRLNIKGGLFKYGELDSTLGALLSDIYREGETDLNHRTRFDYGRWLRLEALSKSETDEQILFSGAVEPQSPIHTVTEKYSGRFSPNTLSSIEHSLETTERKDIFLGSLIGEKVTSQNTRLNFDATPLSFRAEYGLRGFNSLVGARNDVDSTTLNAESFYRATDKFNASGFFEDREDLEVQTGSKLHSRNSRTEIGIKPARGLKIRDRLALKEDDDTKTDEDIAQFSNEIILNVDPMRAFGAELTYKRAEDDKTRVLEDITSTTNEEKIRLKILPASGVNIQGGYRLSDKVSTSSSENIKDNDFFSDVSLEPITALRLGGNFTHSRRQGGLESSVDSDTTTLGTSAQYRPKPWLALFTQLNTSKTDNRSTGSFNATDTLSSNLSADLTSFLSASLRTSGQKVRNSSSDPSERLLNSVELDLKLTEHLKVVAEYELIDSSGLGASDESLADIGFFYGIGRLDLSLRLQQRVVAGDNSSDKTAFIGNLKYRFSPAAVLSFQLYYTDYSDKINTANTYESMTAESKLSMRF